MGAASAAIQGGNIWMGAATGAISGLFGGLGAWGGATFLASTFGKFWGPVIGGALGGAAGGAISAAVTGGNVGIGAATGAVSGIASGILYGAGYLPIQEASRQLYATYIMESIALGYGAGFANTLIQGGSFEDALVAGGIGAGVTGGVALLNIAATEMQIQERRASLEHGQSTRPSPHSEGFRGSGDKLAGSRDTYYPTKRDVINKGSPLGGVQRGQGYIGPMRYARGSFWDHLLETVAGPHDWLNHNLLGSYNARAMNVNQGALINSVRFVGNVINLPLATPFAVASQGYYLTPYISGRHD